MPQRYRDYARFLLAGIRFLNGAVALLAPQLIIRRFRDDADTQSVARYALRMFGIRTILIAIDLLRPEGLERSHAVRVAPIIHGSDLIAATLAARSGSVPAQTGKTIVVISGINTLLSLAMQGDNDCRKAAPPS
jgi:hypothetical protein